MPIWLTVSMQGLLIPDNVMLATVYPRNLPDIKIHAENNRPDIKAVAKAVNWVMGGLAQSTVYRVVELLFMKPIILKHMVLFIDERCAPEASVM